MTEKILNPTARHPVRARFPALALLAFILVLAFPGPARGFTVVDTGQDYCYDNTREVACPDPGEPFYGQDAQLIINAPSYRDNGDGTVTDLNTGLMWQQGFVSQATWAEAVAGAAAFNLAGYDDWRLPTIKELYSLIDFNGSVSNLIPYIDTDYFDFEWGTVTGGRVIDSQYWSATDYVGGPWNGRNLVFGVNFADGRIKGYPDVKQTYVRYVRDNTDYSVNDFVDNGDGTITDNATGLMWMRQDSGAFGAGTKGDGTLDWEEALAWADGLEYAGYDDWRLPNAKELQTIVDYTRAPDALDPDRRGPAIDPVFDATETESWFWTGTSHLDTGGGTEGAYICFGQCFGIYDGTQVNVHGAGAQRSDPKSGDPNDYPDGRGPQNDEVRIYNYARLVRAGDEGTEGGGGSGGGSSGSGSSSESGGGGGGGCFLGLLVQ